MKTFFALIMGTLALLGTGATFAQSGNRMNGGTWGSGRTANGWMGGYGGTQTPPLVIVVVGLLAWIFKLGGKCLKPGKPASRGR
jgi:hypothetical protein